jgi:hypothetical protein
MKGLAARQRPANKKIEKKEIEKKNRLKTAITL